MSLRVTLHWRIAATVAVAVLASTVAVTYVAYRLESSGTRSRFLAAAVAGARADVQQARAATERNPNENPLDVVAKYVEQRGGMQWLVSDVSRPGDQRSSGAVRFGELPGELQFGATFRTGWFSSFGTDYLAVAGRVTGVVELYEFYDYGPVRDQLARLRSDLIRLDAVGLIAALVLGLAVATRISRPVRRAAQAAQRLGSGELDTRIPVRGHDELAELASSFNDMAARLSAAMAALRESQAQQRRFVADVSHELRTPLAAMLAAGDELTSSDPGARERAAVLVTAQTRRLSRMVEDLLEISRFDAGQARLQVEEVDLAALAADVVHTVGAAASIEVRAVGAVTVRGDARRLHAVLRNLVANALQHGAPPVLVHIDGEGERVVVSVVDSGSGVPPDVAPRIFDRFVRATASRTTASGSTGLGLAIARENALLHGATLTVQTGGHGVFVLSLPRQPDEGNTAGQTPKDPRPRPGVPG